MIKHQGGCHCGKVRFTTEYDPLLVGQCNCTRCRRLYGTMSVGAMFGENELEVSGETYEYTFNGGSGMPVHLHSCSTCGTRIYAEPEAFGGMVYVLLGSFDNSLEFEPKGEIFTKYKMRWLRDNGCIQESFEEAAVLERMQALMENLDQRA